MHDFSKIAVIGGGSWATAIIKILCENNNSVGWYVRNKKVFKHLKKEGHNPNYLSSVTFNLNLLDLQTDINIIAAKYDVLILATPSYYLGEVLSNLKESLENKVIFSAVKGIIPEKTQLVGAYLANSFCVHNSHFGVITGPCHAEEVALERLSYLTIASSNLNITSKMKEKLNCSYIQSSISQDVIGLEYAATLKNVYSIAVGIANGLGYGDNFVSVLVTNAIREMKLFLNQIDNTIRSVDTSPYLGDLLVTSYSGFSRNRMLGDMIGKGYRVKAALIEMKMVAEGYYGSKTVNELCNSFTGEYPILKSVYQVLYESKSAKKKMRSLSKLLF
jgi:glycerol-3-phosphate dehydrogenase (NAD(P)+)